MKLLFKQRFISLFDSYDVYNESNEIYFKVKGKFAIGRHFKIYNSNDEEIGRLRQKLFTILPKYKIYKNDQKLGEIKKQLTLFTPKFKINFNNYTVKGNFFEWDYNVYKDNKEVAKISKELFHLVDTYIIDVNTDDALIALMIVIAIDAIKDRKHNN